MLDEAGTKAVLDELHDLLECITGGEIHGLEEVQAASPLGEVLRDLMVRFQRREEQLNELRTEVSRLKAGRLTPEEFNELCHNLHESGRPIPPDQHEAACAEFRRKLYGPTMNTLREKIEANWSPSPMDGDRIVDQVT